MSDPSQPRWTDHDVSDPGITLLEALAYGLGLLAVAGAATALVRRRHRDGACAGR